MTKLNKKILVVEDDKILTSTLLDNFTNEGFSVITASDGEEGLIMANKETPDLILLDILMPKIDGITMARKLKENSINTPIIFLTNLDNLKHISDAIEVAESDYLIKSDWKVNDIVAKVKDKLNLK
ncbi:MAG: response regulator [Candidatus Portnoybacteria bacterium CG06_land_8_20_14_3_00_39_12]|uniref:Response regulator n=2 Tax=Candidatus Portnoyibacteriota TaxID=1817913 RepID=A0A2M7UJF2_9BACT|nr:MAG: hypothetical protein AUJ33_02885 [Parcubacteria group bacterium CG1_02_40_25]PIU75256.1 MAG: response regulator [Candidatus Portnoybacteria bacterium CG06_land_8_20_14_3_00_39_12]PIZ71364.1 MAG: response regulator [Candidatus Portnoybacteria bacterium CG_4_10_14_0_2_um_filter_39_11]